MKNKNARFHPVRQPARRPIMAWSLAGLLATFHFVLPATAATSLAGPQETSQGTGSRLMLDIPPGSGNPRNSEGAFLGLKDGRILFIYSRFEDSPHVVARPGADEAKARLAMRFSGDGGETWSNDTILTTPEEDQAMNVMDVSLLRMENGDIGMFYNLRRSWMDLRLQLRRSSDEGLTWSQPTQCIPVAGYWVVLNDRIVRLSSGRLVLPAVLHRQLIDFTPAEAAGRNPAEPHGSYKKLDWRGIAFFFLSDDDGRTWREAPGNSTLPAVHTKEPATLQETGVVELLNGTLWAWARTNLGTQYQFFSWDGGETWSQPGPSRFTSPNSPMSIKRIPNTDRFLAIWNPAPNYETRPIKPTGGDRTPLVGATGPGPGGAWTPAYVIEGQDGVDAGYHYTAIHFTKDAVLLAYCAGNTQDKHRLNRVRIRKMSLSLFK